MKTIIRMMFFSIALAVAGQANALVLSPGDEYTSETFFPTYTNPDEDDVAAIVNSTNPFDLLYKDNVGGAEEGISGYLDAYETTYSNTPNDPSDALISYVGGDIMDDALWLVVKDGNHDPSWYLFDISTWDGVEDIQLTGFWPAQGAISHVSFIGNDSSTDVSEPGILALFGMALLGLGVARRKAK